MGHVESVRGVNQDVTGPGTERTAGDTGFDTNKAAWRGINPDGTPDEVMLAKITAAIVDAVQPQRIILFGSAARGQMNATRDFDILVVKDGMHYRRASRSIHMQLPAPNEASGPGRGHEPEYRTPPAQAVLRHRASAARRTSPL